MTRQARFNGVVIAESDDTEIVEGNPYFPEDSVRMEFLTPTKLKTVCPWKGLASYYSVTVGEQTAKNVAWQYKHPLPLARRIRRYVAFYPQVEVTEAAVDDEVSG